MADSCDVFVAGGGPAGLAAATCARQRGMDVLVADVAAPPIDKPCAEGLMPDGLDALEQIGISRSALAGWPVEGARFYNSESKAEARYPGRLGMGVRRIRLHEVFLQHATDCGVKFSVAHRSFRPERGWRQCTAIGSPREMDDRRRRRLFARARLGRP